MPRAQDVAGADAREGGIPGSVALHRDQPAVGDGGVADGEFDAVGADTHLGLDGEALLAQPRGEVGHERVATLGGGRLPLVYAARLGVREQLDQAAGRGRPQAAGVEVAGAERRHDHEFLPGPRRGGDEGSFATGKVERREAVQHPAVRRAAVADGEQHDVAQQAVGLLDLSHDERLDPDASEEFARGDVAVEPADAVANAVAHQVGHVGGEGEDGQGLVAVVPGVFQDELDDPRDLGSGPLDGAVGAGQHGRGALDMVEAQRGDSQRRRGTVGDPLRRQQRESGVEVGVPPGEATLGQDGGGGGIQGGRGGRRVGDGTGSGAGAEGARDGSVGTTDDERLAASGQRRHGFGDADRGGVVEDDHVDGGAGREDLRDGIRADGQARTQGADDPVGLAVQGRKRQVPMAEPRLRVQEVGLAGVLASALAGATVDDRADPARVARASDLVEPGELVGGQAQGAAVVVGVARVAGADLLAQRRPPDVLDLGGHVLGGDPARGEVIHHLAHPRGPQLVDDRSDLGQDVEPVEPLGQPGQAGAQQRERGREHRPVVGSGAQPLVEPGEVGNEPLVCRLALLQPRGDLGPAAGADEVVPGDPLVAGADQLGVQVGRGATGTEHSAGLAAHARARPAAELDGRLGAIGAAAGGDDVLVERDVEDLGPEDLEGLVDAAHGDEGVAPVGGGAGRAQAGLDEDRVEIGGRRGQVAAGEPRDDVAGPLDLGLGADGGAVPGVAALGRPGSRGGCGLQVLGQLGDPCAGELFEGGAADPHPGARRGVTRGEGAHRLLDFVCRDSPRAAHLVDRGDMVGEGLLGLPDGGRPVEAPARVGGVGEVAVIEGREAGECLA
ncbi:MAG: hypothetical protein BWY91_01719 [bacterium ADurb.BinA028]|nr:MAG: hypothetical protein BWY91_01719 [bacterium ADurb.BinA028]